MKKKFLFLPCFAIGLAVALTSCNSAPAELVYKDAEGSEVKTTITKTENEEEVAKAVAAMAECAEESTEEIKSIGGSIYGKADFDCNVEYANLLGNTISNNYKIYAETNDEVAVGFETVDGVKLMNAYAKASVKGKVSSSSTANDASNNSDVDLNKNVEGFYTSNEPKIYLSIDNQKGFADTNASWGSLPTIDASSFNEIFKQLNPEESLKTIQGLIDLDFVQVSISNTYKDAIEFTVKFTTPENSNLTGTDLVYVNAFAGAEIKVTFSTKYFVPVKLSANLCCIYNLVVNQISTLGNVDLKKSELYIEANLTVNQTVKKLSEADKANYTVDLNQELKSLIDSLDDLF